MTASREFRTTHAVALRWHLILAAGVGLAVRLLFVWRFPTVAGDTLVYEALARNWLDYGVYGVLAGGRLIPADVRVPGYPAFLAGAYILFGRSRLAVMLLQAALDLGTCLVTAGLAARLAEETARRRVSIAAMWLAATCPFVANYAAVPMTEVLATFLTTAGLWFFIRGCTDPNPAGVPGGRAALIKNPWFLASLSVGLGTLVRPETPLVLVAAAAVLLILWRRRPDWPKLLLAGGAMSVGFFLPVLPWAARNLVTLHRVQLLAPRYSQLPGEFVPRGLNAWTQTWLIRFRDVYLVSWKVEDEPIAIEDVPSYAFDGPEERARVAELLEGYNQTLTISPETDAAFAQIAAQRTARHPLRTYLFVPLARAFTMWFTPRIELLPVSGSFWPPGEKWSDDRLDFCTSIVYLSLNIFYPSLALAGAVFILRRPARDTGPANQSTIGLRAAGRPPSSFGKCFSLHPGLALVGVFILVRTAFMTQVETPEPRYVLECIPAVLALSAQLWSRPRASSSR